MSSSPIIKTNGLSKHFGSIVAVDEIDMQIRKEDVTSIIGPNGAGKTTLISLLSGKLTPTEGEIYFNGEDITEFSEVKRVKQGLIKSFQEPQLFESLSVKENLLVSALSYNDRNSSFLKSLDSEEESIEQVEQILSDFDLLEYEEMAIEDLPHGIHKIVDIAVAIVGNPEIILLDEPTSGVGSDQKHSLIQTILSAIESHDITVVFIEHDMELVTQYSDHVIALHQGSVIKQGTPDEVLDSEIVKEHIREEGA